MSVSLRTIALVTAAVAVTSVSASGCHSKPTSAADSSNSAAATTGGSSPASSAKPQSTDYSRLLIKATDIDTPMAFTADPVTPNPNGQAGVQTTFSNDDKTRQIHDTILVFGDPAAAASALEAAKAKLGDSVRGTPAPAVVGSAGSTVSGNSPDGAKGVMMLLFTEGRALTTLNFVGPPDMLPPPDFVTELGQKQDTAIKNGLS
ncbi:hypothetical protein [Mycobacterium sp.]|uniref:hypothetical protein n=1 Tax=Mycobacterium sp. TaxID=1785 RepID=UPI003D14E8D4